MCGRSDISSNGRRRLIRFSGTAAHREAPPQPPRPASSPGQGTRRTHRLGQITVAAVIVAVVGMVFSTIESSQTRSTGNQPANSAPQLTSQAPQSPSVDAQPRVRQHLSIAQISEAYREALKKQPGLGMALQKFSRYAQEKLPDYDFSEGINYSPPKETPAPNTEISASAATAATPGTIIHAQTGSAEVETKDYFTVGSTKDEVLAVQGVPFSRSPSDGVFTYRYGSQVFFKDDRVTSWRNSRENPLKAKLESSPP